MTATPDPGHDAAPPADATVASDGNAASAAPRVGSMSRLLPPEGAAPVPMASLPPDRARLGSVRLEFSGAQPTSTVLAGLDILNGAEPVARISFRDVGRHARLLAEIPVAAETTPGGSNILLGARLHSTGPSVRVEIGLVEGPPGTAWRWRDRRPQAATLGQDWQDLFAVWPEPPEAATGPVHLMLQFAEDAEVELLRLDLGRLAVHAAPMPASLLLQPARDFLPSPSGPWPFPLPMRAARCRGLLALAQPEAADSSGWGLMLRSSDGSQRPVPGRFVPSGPRLLLYDAPWPGAGELLLTRQGALPLPLSTIPDGSVTLERCDAVWAGGALLVRVELRAPNGFAELRAELLTEGQVVATAVLMPGETSGLRAEFRLDWPREELAALRLALRLSALRVEISLDVASQLERKAPAPLFALVEAEQVEGALEGLQRNRAGAWVVKGVASDPNFPGAALRVDLFTEAHPIAAGWAQGRQRDAAGGWRCGGFSIELPPNWRCGETLDFEARPRARNGRLVPGILPLRLPPFGHRLAHPGPPMQAPAVPSSARVARSCAAIVLTQDGADVLRDMLESLCAHDLGALSRLIVVDHESQDDTAAVLERYAPLLPLQRLVRPRDSSFAASNNAAAKLCGEEVLLFLNNDIVFAGPTIAALAAEAGPERGLVGLRLLDDPVPDEGAATQHSGIHFDPGGTMGVRPFESRQLSDLKASGSLLAVPAATGAFLAVNREVFEALGGFDEAFFYGGEDVDICLRALAAGRRNVVVQDAFAYHLRGHTRRQMPLEAAARREANRGIFARRWGPALRVALRREQLEATPFWTGRRLHVGFVLDDPADPQHPDTRLAIQFAREFEQTLPSTTYLLDRAEKDMAGLDLLVVLSSLFDPRRASGLAASLRLVAWPQRDFASWAARPWRHGFDLWLAPSAIARAWLGRRLARPVELLLPALLSSSVYNAGAAGTAVAVLCREAEGEAWARRLAEALPEVEVHPLPANTAVADWSSYALAVEAPDAEAEAWGLTDHRLLKAIAAGLPVIGGGLSAASAPGIVSAARTNPDALIDMVEQALRAPVPQGATLLPLLSARVGEFLAMLRQSDKAGLRIGVKCSEGAEATRFAEMLALALVQRGHRVRVDPPADWLGPLGRLDDVALVLLGEAPYVPWPDQISLAWVVSHPERQSVAELDSFDAVFAASAAMIRQLEPLLQRPPKPMPLCVETVPDGAADPSPLHVDRAAQSQRWQEVPADLLRALAAGRPVIADPTTRELVAAMDPELAAAVMPPNASDGLAAPAVRSAAARRMAEAHSFAARATELDIIMRKMHRLRATLPGLGKVDPVSV